MRLVMWIEWGTGPYRRREQLLLHRKTRSVGLSCASPVRLIDALRPPYR